MADYKLSNVCKEDLIRIHQYGVRQFGMAQADKYYNVLFEHFDRIAERPYSFESVENMKKGYRRCVCGSDSIYFRVNEITNMVEIMSIIGKQDFGNTNQ